MGLNKLAKTPCGFCFVVYHTHEDAMACKKFIRSANAYCVDVLTPSNAHLYANIKQIIATTHPTFAPLPPSQFPSDFTFAGESDRDN